MDNQVFHRRMRRAALPRSWTEEVTTWEQVEQLISQLNPIEKLQLLRRVADELAREEIGVESDPRVCGGEARVRGTRIPVWVLAQAVRLGQTDADILRAYPTLKAEGLAPVLLLSWICLTGFRLSG